MDTEIAPNAHGVEPSTWEQGALARDADTFAEDPRAEARASVDMQQPALASRCARALAHAARMRRGEHHDTA